MPWGAAIGAAATLASSAISSGSKDSGGSQSGTSSTAPWGAQQPYLQQGFSNADAIYNNRLGQGAYQGSFYAPATHNQQLAGQNLYDGAMSNGSAVRDATYATAGQLLPQGALFAQNASAMQSGGTAGPNAGLMGTLQNYGTNQQASTPQINGGLSSALNQAAITGANGVLGGQGTLSQVQQKALQDPTQATAASAGQYASNPYVQAQIDAANATTDRTLNEQTLPGLNRQASLGGNLNSSRAGMAEAMANRDAATIKANTAATIGGQAYNNGLNLAAQQREAGLNTATTAGSAAAQNGTTAALGTGSLQQQGSQQGIANQLSAANQGLTQGLGYQNLNASTQLAANAQLGTAAGLGINAANSGIAQNGQIGQQALAGSGVWQADQQGQLNNAFQQWGMQNGYQQSALNDYMKSITGNYGSTGTSTQATQLPSNYIGSAIGGGLAGSSLYNSGTFDGLFGSNSNSTVDGRLNGTGYPGYGSGTAAPANIDPYTTGGLY